MAKRPVEKYDFKAFGEAIKAARTGRRESRKQVSDEMYISPRYLANIENKGQHPSLQIFFELMLRYNISVDQFLLDTPAGKDTKRRQLDALLDDMSDNGIRIVTAAAKDTVLSACLNGTVVPLADVKDEAFASGALGDGIAIEPTDGELVAPADGEISSTFETHHAVGMTTADGAELLMHIGIDTVKLGGRHFTYLVNEGDKVKKGQPLIRFELEAIKAEGYPVTTPLIVCNTDDYAAVAAKASGTVKQGDALLELKH